MDSIRILAGHNDKVDLLMVVAGSMVALWVIVALLVLIESIRQERIVPAALFYVVTMATFLLTAPVLQTYAATTHVVEGVIMCSNIAVHAWQFARLQAKPAAQQTDDVVKNDTTPE
ncbi:MAG: hypothetical protein SGJ27_25900 [Candidatus Melainabacteria bacterium]|nr:hypothetical protein [Candidatus Melainabacteria bacterium]